MELGENGRLVLEHPERWSGDVVDFLALTMTDSAKQLAKVCGF